MIPLLLAFVIDDLADARKRATEAVEAYDAAKAAPAVEAIAKINTRPAAAELVNLLELCGKRRAALAQQKQQADAKIQELQPDPLKAPKEAAAKEELAKQSKASAECFVRLEALAQIGAAASAGLGAVAADAALPELTTGLSIADAFVRSACALALGRIKDPRSMEALTKRLKAEKDPTVKVAILDALAAMEATDAFAAIAPLLNDPEWPVAVSAARALHAAGSFDAIPLLIAALEKAKGRVREEVNLALVGLTRVDKHGDVATWKSWWAQNGAAVRDGTYDPPLADMSRPGDRGATTFYGVSLTSDRVIFAIDASGSMKTVSTWKPVIATGSSAESALPPLGEEPSKFDVAKYELKKALLKLKDGTRFNIVFFHGKVWAFQPDQMAVLDKATRARAFEFMDKVEMAGGTDIHGALRKAFEIAGVLNPAGPAKGRFEADTVFILSDGIPYISEGQAALGGTKEVKEILKRVRAWNERAKLVINAIGIYAKPTTPGKPDAGEKMMVGVSGENGGTYVEPGAPPKPAPKPPPPPGVPALALEMEAAGPATVDLDLTNKSFTVGALCTPAEGDGVVASHGSSARGFSLFLKEGVPQFAVSCKRKPVVVAGPAKLETGKAVHLAGSIDAAGTIRLYVDGAPVGEAKGALIEASISGRVAFGSDPGSQMGPYKGDSPFKGEMKDIRLYWNVPDAATIRTWAGK